LPQLEQLLAFNRQLDSLAADPDVVPGLGRTSVWGGKYDAASGEGKTRELRSLFRIFLEERLAKTKSVRPPLSGRQTPFLRPLLQSGGAGRRGRADASFRPAACLRVGTPPCCAREALQHQQACRFIKPAYPAWQQVDDALESDLEDLQLALALGPREAAGVREEVISAAYRLGLSGRCNVRTSAACVMTALCAAQDMQRQVRGRPTLPCVH